MSKHLSIFNTESQFNAALESLEFPHVSLIENTGELKFLKFEKQELYDAPFGSIIMAAVESEELFYISDYNDYNLTDYPLAEFKPIAICIYDHASREDNTTVLMSVQWPDRRYPGTGKANSGGYQGYACYGMYGINISTEHPIFKDTTATSKQLNDEMKKIVIDDWQTASLISNTNNVLGYAPGFEICWRFKTIGTKEGDWMLPSRYDYGKYTSQYTTIDTIMKHILTTAGTSYLSSIYTEGYLANLTYTTNHLYCDSINRPSYGGCGFNENTLSRNSNQGSCQRPVMYIKIEEL